MEEKPRVFRLTWLTSTPISRGTWFGIILGLFPMFLALLSLLTILGVDADNRGAALLSGALFISMGAILIQLAAYLGRVELASETLWVFTRFSGKRGCQPIPLKAIEQTLYLPLDRPPRWLPFAWGILEVICVVGAISAAGGASQWYWLAVLVIGLSFWPMMAARWRAGMVVVLIYRLPKASRPGVIRAWATPQEAGSLVNTLLGKIDWAVPPRSVPEAPDAG